MIPMEIEEAIERYSIARRDQSRDPSDDDCCVEFLDAGSALRNLISRLVSERDDSTKRIEEVHSFAKNRLASASYADRETDRAVGPVRDLIVAHDALLAAQAAASDSQKD